MVFTAISQPLITLPCPNSKLNTVLSSRVESNTSLVSAKVPSYCTANFKEPHLVNTQTKNYNGSERSESYSQQGEDLLLELQHQAQPVSRSSLAHPHHQIGLPLPSPHATRNMQYFCFYSFILKSRNRQEKNVYFTWTELIRLSNKKVLCFTSIPLFLNKL